MATAAVDTEPLPELSPEDILNADLSIYPTNWPAFPDFLDQPFDVKNTGVQETTNLDGENIFDSKDFNLDVYGNYEFDVCRIPDPPWDSHIDPAVLQNDLQNRPATLPLASVEESSSNPTNSVTPFQQFLNIALPEDTLQRALQEDPEDSSGGICTNRPKQPRFPPESVAILKIWLEKHMENPYPTSQEKIELAAMTHLSVQQVGNWFVNYRQRQLPPKRQMSPMEAWLSGSSNDEAASDGDIRRALQSQRKKDTPMYDIEPRTKSSSFQIPGPPSDARSVSTGSISSISSTASAFSQCQDAVLSGPPRRGRKRHYGLLSNPLKLGGRSDRNSPKKRKAASDVASDTDGPSSDLNFQCTFCYKSLSSKTWKRHETTQHFPHHQWTCMKNGFRTAYDPLTCQKSVEGFLSPPKSMCIFCNSSDPDESHAVSCHRISQCLENPESDRTFSRKDHLSQHLRRFHNSSLNSFFLESWKSKTELDGFEWNCGFCGDSLRGWDIRANHIAKHFLVEFMGHLNAYAALTVQGNSRIYLNYRCMKCEGLFVVIAALFGSKHIGIVPDIVETITLKEASGPAHQF